MRGRLLVGVAIVVAFGPALLAPWRYVVGEGGVDAWGTQWFFWFAGRVLTGAEGADHTDLLFYPWGKDILLHTGGNLLDAWFAWPLRVLTGPVIGYNLWILAVLAGNAWAGTRLAAALGVERERRWIAGVALVLNPYVLMEINLGRPTQAFLLFPGLCAALLWTLGRSVGWRGAAAAAGCGVCLALSAWIYWYNGLVLGALALVHGVWRTGADSGGRARTLGHHALAALVAVALVAPAAWTLLHALDGGEVPGLLALDGTGPLAPLALRTVDGEEEGLWVLALAKGGSGSLIDEGGLRYVAGTPVLLAVQIPVALLGLWGMRRRRAGWLWLWLGGVLLVGSGPLFIYADSYVVNRAYLSAMTGFDVLRRWWWPARAVFAAHLVLAALAPVALGVLPARVRALAGAALLAGAAVQMHASGLFPLGRWDAGAGTVLRCLATAPAGAVIDVPWSSDQKNLWFQTVHQKPILGGMLIKKPSFGASPVIALRARNSLLDVLMGIGEHQYGRNLDSDAAARRELVELGYRYVLARTDAFARPRSTRTGMEWVSDWSRARRLLEKSLGAGPVIEDADHALWTLDGSGVGCP